MPRTILIHLNVSIPDKDRRAPATIAQAIGATLKPKFDVEIGPVRVVDKLAPVYTVHPFDDEWVWDPANSGAYPWATSSLQEAIDHANLVRLEHASTEGVDPDWIAGFWSAIYHDDPAESARADSMIGYVDPQGDYHEGDDPPIREDGSWVGWRDE